MYTKKILAALCGLALASMVGCGGESADPGAETGDLSVSVTQALSTVSLENIDRVEVELEATPTPSDMLDGTYVLGFNGAEWTSKFEGVQAGCYFIQAKAFVVGVQERVFESARIRTCVSPGNETAVRVVLNQVELQEGVHAPIIDWITTDATTVRPGGSVQIKVGFRDDDATAQLVATTDDAGGDFLNPITTALANNKFEGSITWRAPTEPSGLPEEIEVELTDGKAHVRLQLFFRIIWPATDVTANFKLNLAPVVNSLRVDPANPVDGNPLVRLAFDAIDPDPCDAGDQGCVAPKFSWSIPAGCDYFTAWRLVRIGSFRVYLPVVSDDAHLFEGTYSIGEADLGTEDVYLQYPLDPAASCDVTLTLTDGDGAKTVSTLTIKPFELVTHYTPSIEIDFQHGFVAEPGYELEFGILSNLRVPLVDFYADNPKIYWSIGGQPYQLDVAATTVRSGLFWATRSEKAWTVAGTQSVQCIVKAGQKVVEVKAKACNPMVPAGVASELCSELVFDVEVPHPDVVCAP